MKNSEIAELLQKLIGTLERVDKRLEADAVAHKGWTEVAEELHAFRDEIRGSQRRTAEALAIGRKNARASQKAVSEMLKGVGQPPSTRIGVVR